MFVWEKHSSLLRHGVSYVTREFFNIGLTEPLAATVPFEEMCDRYTSFFRTLNFPEKNFRRKKKSWQLYLKISLEKKEPAKVPK